MTPEQDRIAHRNENYVRELTRWWVYKLKTSPIEDVIDLEEIYETS